MEDEQQQYGDELEEQYEEEIPVDGAGEAAAGGEAQGADAAAQELEAMKNKLKEMENEAARLRALQQGAAGGDASASAAADVATKEEIDSRSVYVGSVDYNCTPEELQQHFQSCGTVNRVTILTDKFGAPKGYAYIEFLEVDAVNNAVLLDNSELRGRNLKVVQKRTNLPGLKIRGRGRGRGGGGYPPPFMGRGGYGMPMPYGMAVPYAGGGRGRGGYPGYVPRGRGRGRGFYAPY